MNRYTWRGCLGGAPDGSCAGVRQMKLDVIDRMQSEGRISNEGYEAFASGFVEACHSGAIRHSDAEHFLQIGARRTDRPPTASASMSAESAHRSMVPASPFDHGRSTRDAHLLFGP